METVCFLAIVRVGLNGLQAWLWIVGWSWGCSAFDADLDGDQDLYVVNGHITGPGGRL